MKNIIAYVKFLSGFTDDGEDLANKHLVDFYEGCDYAFHEKFRNIQESLEVTGILVPRDKRAKYQRIKVFLGDPVDYDVFLRVFKEVYIPNVKGLNLEWVDVQKLVAK